MTIRKTHSTLIECVVSKQSFEIGNIKLEVWKFISYQQIMFPILNDSFETKLFVSNGVSRKRFPCLQCSTFLSVSFVVSNIRFLFPIDIVSNIISYILLGQVFRKIISKKTLRCFGIRKWRFCWCSNMLEHFLYPSSTLGGYILWNVIFLPVWFC